MIRPSSLITPSTSTSTNTNPNTTTTTNGNVIGVSNEIRGNVAAKVSEVFLTASHAFQKIGDLTLQLSHMNSHTKSETEESKWSEKEIDQLKDALSRFADELDNISTSVQARMKKQIKIDIRRGIGNTNPRASTLTTGSATTTQNYQQYLSTKRPNTSSQPSSSLLSNGPPPKRFAYAGGNTNTLSSPTSQMTSYRPVSINAAGRTVTLQPISRQRYVNVPAGSLSSGLTTSSSQNWSSVDPEPTDIFEQPTTSFSPVSLNR